MITLYREQEELEITGSENAQNFPLHIVYIRHPIIAYAVLPFHRYGRESKRPDYSRGYIFVDWMETGAFRDLREHLHLSSCVFATLVRLAGATYPEVNEAFNRVETIVVDGQQITVRTS